MNVSGFWRLYSPTPLPGRFSGACPNLGLANWYLAAGGVFQTIWNVVTGRDPQAGIKDYDVFYFDSHDLSYEAEDAVIKRANRLFADIPATIEVRNEARVHLWYEQKFGVQRVSSRAVRTRSIISPRRRAGIHGVVYGADSMLSVTVGSA